MPNVNWPTNDLELYLRSRMKSAAEIRQLFLDFYKEHGHEIVPSAPIVIKNDPTLMFTNAGMNQFKDWFLGNEKPQWPRVADTQKCLRVSGKHNDLEEVGLDTYHHTMFEMLGNWSFGDYFKKDAIKWAWELLTSEKGYGLPKEKLYVTVFEGDEQENLLYDMEAFEVWKNLLPESHILKGNKKDNFWEMGDTGPCGPCSEIHFDSRTDQEIQEIPGASLVNMGHPQVIEIWNLVFMEFNRKADKSLEKLPNQHVDTGMGFERLVRVIQGKQSNYDTDVFSPLIQHLEKTTGISYTGSMDKKSDIAMRVIADHIRAVSFAIADGQLPSNTGAGYVIRRILRRAIRYGFSFLDRKSSFMFKLVDTLSENMGHSFPELNHQLDFVKQVIREEENAFLHTLETGMQILNQIMTGNPTGMISGEQAFQLYDTHGFPLDLTSLITRENHWQLDEKGFHQAMEEQKKRSRQDAETDMGDWVFLQSNENIQFKGYTDLKTKTRITRYRKVSQKGKDLFQIVLNETPFYAESGGQVGDTGSLFLNGEKIDIIDTRKENNLYIHLTTKLPKDIQADAEAHVDEIRRFDIMNNHTATHLLQAALRNVLGNHVQQKGSLVHPDYLRFDFSHFSKVSEAELDAIEKLINKDIQAALPKQEYHQIPIDEALKMGATALFGEKYGTHVRVISFGGQHSMELCGGTHVQNTKDIGILIITSESSVAAGVRRIEAITGRQALNYLQKQNQRLQEIQQLFPQAKDVVQASKAQSIELQTLQKKYDTLLKKETDLLREQIIFEIPQTNTWQIFVRNLGEVPSADILKDLSFSALQAKPQTLLCLGAVVDQKPCLSLMLPQMLVKEKNIHAGNIIKVAAKHIQGGGGGQPFYATAGGNNSNGLDQALRIAEDLLKSSV